MSGEPCITFIDRNGKPTVVGPNFPVDGLPGIPVCDAAGNALAIRAAVPRDARPCTGIAGPVAVALELEEFIPYIDMNMRDDESRLDDWTCNAYSENFNNPPLASPPWTWGDNVVFVGGKISGVQADLLYHDDAGSPAVATIKFSWETLLAGNLQSQFDLGTTAGWARHRWGRVAIDAFFTAPPPTSFSIILGAYHEKVGTTSSGLIWFDPRDPYDLNGEVLTVSIWDAGKVTVNFFGQTHDNGGSM